MPLSGVPDWLPASQQRLISAVLCRRSAQHSRCRQDDFSKAAGQLSGKVHKFHGAGRLNYSRAAQVAFGEVHKIVGADPALGAWDLGRAPEMAWSEGDVWRLDVSLPAAGVTEFKASSALWYHVVGSSWPMPAVPHSVKGGLPWLSHNCFALHGLQQTLRSARQLTSSQHGRGPGGPFPEADRHLVLAAWCEAQLLAGLKQAPALVLTILMMLQ